MTDRLKVIVTSHSIVALIVLGAIVLLCLSPSRADDVPAAVTQPAPATSPSPRPTPIPGPTETPSASPSPGNPAATEDESNTSPNFGGPVVPQPWYSIEEEVVPSYDRLSGSSNMINLRAQLPLGRILNALNAFKNLQISRLKIPIVTSAPGNDPTGLGDTTLVELEYMGSKQQQWIVGPSFKLPTASTSGLGSGKWSVGPAAGYSFVQDGRTIGIYMQSFFSFAGPSSRRPVSQLQFQPALVYPLSRGWLIGTSNMQFTYNFQVPTWTVVPLGVRIAKNLKSNAGQLLAGFEAETNLVVSPGAPAWTMRINFKWVPRR
jgi:hypothetical protein